MPKHTIRIVALPPASDPEGRPYVAARCSCGWQGEHHIGLAAGPGAADDAAAHLRDIEAIPGEG
jgi:hypothetical protein